MDIPTALRLARTAQWGITSEYLEVIEAICNGATTPAQAVAARDGKPLDNTRTVENRNGVSIIPINGVIMRYASLFDDISGGVSIQTLARDFTAAIESPQAESILFNIDSPGGMVNGVPEFSQMVYAARGIKPIKAYVGDLCGSAACMIAASCDEIIMHEWARIGSIGVLAMANTSEKPNQKRFVSRQSPKKNLSANSAAGETAIQEEIDRACQMFIDMMAVMRGVSVETVQVDFGQGAVMYADDAIAVGLADRTGTYEALLTELQQAGKPQARGMMAVNRTVTGNLARLIEANTNQNMIKVNKLYDK